MLAFLCSGATIPSNECWCVEVILEAEKSNLAGDRTFDTWSLTVIK